MSSADFMSVLAGATTCRITTTGRRSKESHTVQVWFAVDGGRVFVLSGGGTRSDWVRNLMEDPQVTVSYRRRSQTGRARVIGEASQDRTARQAILDKYGPRYRNFDVWGEDSATVAIEFEG